ncbi:MAG TPA: ribose-phosphate pyrophosphokinase [Firmicutes bacterium]|nr:ribose-phosphate pyrophosphokinase [Bacillota bacterium]HHY97403.1 ribose-phosphate pyrophosphokinase [Bacillota bacterium]
MGRAFGVYDLKVFTGRAHPDLAREVCSFLSIPLGQAEIMTFANENIFVKINESVREADVYVIQPSCSPVNDGLMELLIMIDALKRASAGKITAVIPYYPYSRSDKKDQPRVPITARLVADLLTVAGANRVVTVDLHASQIQGFFSIPVDHLTAQPIIASYFKKRAIDSLVVVAPDAGRAKLATKYAESLSASMAIIDKRRLGNEDVAKASDMVGEVEGRNALLVDDEITTGRSLLEAVGVIRSHGAKDIYFACTHAVLTEDARKRIIDSGVKEVVVTNTVPVDAEKKTENMTVLSVGRLLAGAIRCIHSGGSIGKLFEQEW